MKVLVALLGCLLVMTLGRASNAHPLAPAGLDVIEAANQLVTLRFKQPGVQPRGSRLSARLPAGCAAQEPMVELDDESVTQVFRLACADSLEGKQLGVVGLIDGGPGVVVRVQLADGTLHHALLDASHPDYEVPFAAAGDEVVIGYTGMGISHMLLGFDHVLFVLGMLLLVHERKKLLIALSAFTVGHSLTLCAAVLGWVKLPRTPVEVAIALSLVLMALQLLEPERRPALRRLWPLALSFGLLHGLGFAGALGEAGLPAHELPLALGCFNVGVELAQLAVVVTALVLAPLLTRMWPASPSWRRRVPAYALGSLASMWCLERSLALLS